MVIQRFSSLEDGWRTRIRRIVIAALGTATVAGAAGFHVIAHADERICAPDQSLSLGHIVDTKQLRSIRAGASVLDLPYMPQLAVILWDEARPPAPPVRTAGALQTQTLTASVHVVTK